MAVNTLSRYAAAQALEAVHLRTQSPATGTVYGLLGTSAAIPTDAATTIAESGVTEYTALGALSGTAATTSAAAAALTRTTPLTAAATTTTSATATLSIATGAITWPDAAAAATATASATLTAVHAFTATATTTSSTTGTPPQLSAPKAAPPLAQ